MSKTVMPRDDNSQSIPVLRFRTGGGQKLLVDSSTPQSVTVPEGTRVVTITVSQPCYFESGLAGIIATANSHYIASQFPYDIALGSGISSNSGYHTTISFLAVSTSASVYISERE
jgi:hypothetical protein